MKAHFLIAGPLYSGALGSGLAIFSRFPILSASIHHYSLNGHPVDVTAGDWIVGKAAASVVVRHPALDEVEIFDTHVRLCFSCSYCMLKNVLFQLFAKGRELDPEYIRAHRLVNAWEFAKLAYTSASLGRYVIAVSWWPFIPQSMSLI